MTEEETKIIARLETKVDHLVSIVETQNTILAEHAQQLDTFNKNLTLLNEAQQSHGTKIEHLSRDVCRLQFGSEKTKPELTPISEVAKALGREEVG